MGKRPTIKDVAERAGVSRGTVDRVLNGRGGVYEPVRERVLRAIDDLVSRGAQGLAVCTVDDALIESKVNALAEQNIPVITFNSDLPNSKRIAFVGQDYKRSGRVAAELLSKCIPKNGSVLAMFGNLKYDGHRERMDGFMQRMKELHFPLNQIEVREADDDYHTIYCTVAKALEEKPELAAIYMANQSVLGCTQAWETAEKTGKEILDYEDCV